MYAQGYKIDKTDIAVRQRPNFFGPPETEKYL